MNTSVTAETTTQFNDEEQKTPYKYKAIIPPTQSRTLAARLYSPGLQLKDVSWTNNSAQKKIHTDSEI